MIISPLISTFHPIAGKRLVKPIPPPKIDMGDLLEEEYWTTHLFNENDLNFWTKSRNGNLLIDEYGNNAQILIPAIQLTGTSSYFRLSTANIFKTGGAVWDVIFKFKLDDKTRRDPLFYSGGNSNSLKGITIMPYNGNIIVYSSDGTGPYRTATFAFNLQSNIDYSLRIQWDGLTDGTMTMTLNGSTTLTSTNVMGWSGYSSVVYVDLCAYAGAYYLKGIFRSAVGTIAGDLINFHPCEVYPGTASEWDFSVAGRLLTFTRYNGTRVWEGDSIYCLDYGYSIQQTSIGEITMYIPNNTDGETVDMDTEIAGGTIIISEHAGVLTGHNLYPSYIRFVGSHFDRSNTTIWNDECRTSEYYNISHPKDFYITELNFLTLKGWLNIGYKGKFFLKFDDNSIDRRGTMDELFCYNSDYTSNNEIKILSYSRDIRRGQRNINGIYILDSDGYVELYLYDDLGENAENNYIKYQTLLNAGDLIMVKGYNKYDVILISQPLKPPTGHTLTVNCELRIQNASFSNLISDVEIGDTVINVVSSSDFKVGQHIAISDDILPIQSGGTQTRRVASCGIITLVETGKITINHPSNYAVSSSNNGKVGHCQPVILIEKADNVNIHGSGIINARWQEQYDVECVWDDIEAVQFGSGIAVIESNNVKIIGNSILTIRYAVLHNIVYRGGSSKITNAEVANIDAGWAHDKNILSISTDGIWIHNCECHHSYFEDGLIFYMNNINMLIEDIYEHDNNRTGINILYNEICNAVINNIHCKKSLNLTSSNITINGVTMDGLASLSINNSYSGGNDIEINDLIFSEITLTRLIILEGNIKRINFNECIITNCNTSVGAIYADEYGEGGTFPDDVVFQGGGIYNHTGIKTAIDPLADVTFNDFDGL